MADLGAYRAYRKSNFVKEKRSGGFLTKFGCILLIILAVIGSYAFIQYGNYKSFKKPAGQESKLVDFEVKPGETLDSIASRLVKEGILSDISVFSYPAYKVYLKLNPIESTGIQAGLHQIPVPVSPSEVFSYLKSERCDEIKVTLREGLRIEEYAEELDRAFQGSAKSQFNKSEFITLAKKYSGNPKLGFTPPTNLEGYLFPDTYNFCSEVKTEEVIFRLLSNFETKIITGLKSEVATSDRSLQEVINIAAMIEREARGTEEKKIVAGIIINRLKQKMPLGIDATTQYEHGYSEKQKTWWRTGSELDNVIDRDGLYNTRKRAGLPPTPIANPGLDAMKAVLDPTETTYLYYITGNDGKMYYARDLAGHNSNVCRYITMQCR